MSIMFLLSVLPVLSVLSVLSVLPVLSTLFVLADWSLVFLSRGSAGPQYCTWASPLGNLSGPRGCKIPASANVLILGGANFPIYSSIRQCLVTRLFLVLFGWSNVLTPIVNAINDNDTLFMNRLNPPPTFANQRLR